ncbi:sulfurtransferase TusA family protein [Alphaproteobacteria bacterium LMG 31809]|uniref:Sulfurtransferase TusA family protein n=1 Tax=Govanella unica TaxID=2975056 RepID=A0A9X3Z815_9PROT|nr:sulfurtransferase TusA family protein [Govania unica]
MDPIEDLDVTGLRCPLPILKAGKRLRAMAPGSLLRVHATDPMAGLDFPHFCRETGHDLIEATETEVGLLLFVIRRGVAAIALDSEQGLY